MLRLDSRGFDKDPVNGPFIERNRPCIRDGRLHSLNALPIGKECDRIRMRVRFQFPDRQGIFVAGKSADGDDFKRCEFIRPAETEGNTAKSFVVGDENALGFEPVSEKNDVADAKGDCDKDEKPTFFIHKQMNNQTA